MRRSVAEGKTKRLPLVIGAGFGLVALVLLGLVVFENEVFPEYSPTHRGARAALKAGCFACHGGFDAPASINPVRGGDAPDTVPSMIRERQSLEEIRQWIEDGISEEKVASEAHLRTRDSRVLEMPAYRDRLSAREIEDLVGFVALMQYRDAVSRLGPASEGERLAREQACFTCHGELGQGGVENPGSLKGYVPGFFGNDFRALTRNGDREDIREWIRDGVSRYVWNQGFAGIYPGRYFTERQAIRMPAYGDSLSDAEVETLTDYLLELMELGPLDGPGLLEYRPIGKSPELVGAEDAQGPQDNR
jgi:mono/diheme cytochrome c family protein